MPDGYELFANSERKSPSGRLLVAAGQQPAQPAAPAAPSSENVAMPQPPGPEPAPTFTVPASSQPGPPSAANPAWPNSSVGGQDPAHGNLPAAAGWQGTQPHQPFPAPGNAMAPYVPAQPQPGSPPPPGGGYNPGYNQAAPVVQNALPAAPMQSPQMQTPGPNPGTQPNNNYGPNPHQFYNNAAQPMGQVGGPAAFPVEGATIGFQVTAVEDKTETSPSAKIPMWQNCPIEIEFSRDAYLTIIQQINRAAGQARPHDTHKETGGILIGTFKPFEAGKFRVSVEAVLPMEDGTLAEFSITQAQFAQASPVMRQRWPGMVLVGIYHSHPGHQVFHSGLDQLALGKKGGLLVQPWQFSLVIDHISKQKYAYGYAGIFFDNVKSAEFGIEKPFPDMFGLTPTQASTQTHNPVEPDPKWSWKNIFSIFKRRPKDKTATDPSPENVDSSKLWTLLKGLGRTIFYLTLFVLCPFYMLAVAVAGRGLRQKSFDQLEQWWQNLRPRGRASGLALIATATTAYYIGVVCAVHFLFFPAPLLELTKVEIKDMKPEFNYTTRSDIHEGDLLYVDIMAIDDSGKPTGEVKKRLSLIDPATSQQVLTKKNDSRHVVLGGSLPRSGNYSFKISFLNAKNNQEFHSNWQAGTLNFPIQPPQGFLAAAWSRNEKRPVFRLTWQPPNDRHVTAVKVFQACSSPQMDMDAAMDWKALATFQEAEPFDLTATECKVNGISDKAPEPQYYRYAIRFEGKDGQRSPSVMSQILCVQQGQACKPLDDNDSVAKDFKKRLADARKAAAVPAADWNPTPVTPHNTDGNRDYLDERTAAAKAKAKAKAEKAKAAAAKKAEAEAKAKADKL